MKHGQDEIDLRLLFSNIRKKWHYFAFSVLFFGIAAIVYLRYATPVYEAKASVLIKDSKQSSKNIEDILSGDLFANSKNISTEIGILHSRSVLEETFNELGLGTGYFAKRGLTWRPLYRNAPFQVELRSLADDLYDERFCVDVIDAGRFRLKVSAGEIDFSHDAEHRFGEEIRTPFFTLIMKNGDTIEGGKEFSFIFYSANALIAHYEKNLRIDPINKDATIVELTVRDRVPARAVDFLNTLTGVYISRDVKDKSSVASLTLKFIDEQLAETSMMLNKTEQELQKFKEEKGTIDLSEESKVYLERISSIDEARLKAEIELRTLDYLYDYVSGEKDLENIAPSSIGNPDPLLVELITKLKEQQSKRKSLVYGSSTQSPAVKILDQQIEQTRMALIENINSIRSVTRSNLQGIRGQLKEFENSIRKIPNIERELLGIRRNFTVNENIYLYLLQKKAETGIARATAVSDNKILDDAFLNAEPVAPKRLAVVLISLALALVVPFLIILLGSYLKSTIGGRDDVERHTDIPIVGSVGHAGTGERLVVSGRPKSAIAEAFRSIRANLMYFGLADKHKIVLITSSTGGEGKSFTAINLAAVLSMQHFKVIIVGMDLRKPQLVNDLKLENTEGVSTLLIGKATLDNVIQKTSIEGLDAISSGPVPPNPSELLAKKEVGDLMESLRNRYDYIIIDTPPVGIVSDAVMLMKHADVNIFILREDYSKIDYIKAINGYYTQGMAKNICLLLNDVSRRGYGVNYGSNGHGYYDDEDRNKKWFGKMFRNA